MAELEIRNELGKLRSSNAKFDHNYGISASISGNFAIVGANLDDTVGDLSGAAYLFEQDADGAWEEVQKIQGSGLERAEQFGYSVAIDGDLAVVGAPGVKVDGSYYGAAFVFERDDNGVWEEVAKLMPVDATSGNNTGRAVAIDGDRIIVGAYSGDLTEADTGGDAVENSGTAYVFERNAEGVWVERQKLMSSDAGENDYFGHSVAISGDHALVGAKFEDSSGRWGGAAYLFKLNESGEWEEIKKLQSTDPKDTELFGISVSISGNLAIVGANGVSSFTGMVYVFELNAEGEWEGPRELPGSDLEGYDNYGASVAISGDLAIVGAYGIDTNVANAGAAHVFERGADGEWVEILKLLASDAQVGDCFGNPVAISGWDAIVGNVINPTISEKEGYVYAFKVKFDPPVLDEPTDIKENSFTLNWRAVTGATSYLVDVAMDEGFTRFVEGYQAKEVTDLSCAVAGLNLGAVYWYRVCAVGGAYSEIKTQETKLIPPVLEEASEIWKNGFTINWQALQGVESFLVDVALDEEFTEFVTGYQAKEVNAVSCAVADLSPGVVYYYRVRAVGGLDSEIQSQMTERLPSPVLDNASDSTMNGFTVNWQAVTDAENYLVDVAIDANFAQFISGYQDKEAAGPSCVIEGLEPGVVYFYRVRAVGGFHSEIKVQVTDIFSAPILEDATEITVESFTINWRAVTGAESYLVDVAADPDFTQFVPGYQPKEVVTDSCAVTGLESNTEYYYRVRAIASAESEIKTQWTPRAPLKNEIQKLLASGAQASDNFGYSVAVNGDSAIVGAYRKDTDDANAGAAYILTLKDGEWEESKIIHQGDGGENDYFGCSVSISGSRTIMGARGESTDGVKTGAAHVFELNENDDWVEVERLVASDAEADAEFGVSVAIDDDYAIVGSNLKDAGGVNSGAAYVFKRDADLGWKEIQILQSDDIKARDNFGISVSLSGNRAVVGAYREDTGADNAGAAYVFERDEAEEEWKQISKLQAGDILVEANFGFSASISGDRAIVGARWEGASGEKTGAAYVFERAEAGAWEQVEKLLPGDLEPGDVFGFSVSISGDYAVVGAKSDNEIGGAPGAAYVYERNESGEWINIHRLEASDREANDAFGCSVSMSGSNVFAGAYKEDEAGAGAGAVYVFEV